MAARVALVFGTLLTLGMVLPQVVRIARRRGAVGVSPVWPVLGTVLNAAWTAYLVEVHLYLAALTTLSMTITYLVLAALVLAYFPERRRDSMARGIAVALALAALGAGWGWQTVGTVLGFSYGAQLAPAAVAVFRTSDLSGVSRMTWGIALVEAACWGFYGLTTGESAVVIYGITGIAFTAVICARLMWVDATVQASGSANGSAVTAGPSATSSIASVQAE